MEAEPCIDFTLRIHKDTTNAATPVLLKAGICVQVPAIEDLSRKTAWLIGKKAAS